MSGTQRPEWVARIAQVWGEPSEAQDEPVRARVPATGGTRGIEVRYARYWMWRRGGPGRALYGVRLWNTEPKLRDPRMVLEVSGPLGSLALSRPGTALPTGHVLAALSMAGIPPYVDSVTWSEAAWSEADLTSRQPVNYAQASTGIPTEGEHVSGDETTNVEAMDAEGYTIAADAAQAEQSEKADVEPDTAPAVEFSDADSTEN